MAIALLAMILMAALRLTTESQLPMHQLVRDQIQALTLAERLVERLRAELLAGAPIAVSPAEHDVTRSLLTLPEFADPVRQLAGGIVRDGSSIRVPFRAWWSVSDEVIGGEDPTAPPARPWRIRVRIDWQSRPPRSLVLQTLVARRR